MTSLIASNKEILEVDFSISIIHSCFRFSLFHKFEISQLRNFKVFDKFCCDLLKDIFDVGIFGFNHQILSLDFDFCSFRASCVFVYGLLSFIFFSLLFSLDQGFEIQILGITKLPFYYFIVLLFKVLYFYFFFVG